jgi:zinc/manganese transport system substrate-binding protein
MLVTVSCRTSAVSEKKSIVVTYAVLGSVVSELVGDAADVTVSIPNGLDMHEWEPSAKDIEAINNADLVIRNGLGLETGMEDALQAAADSGVKMFTAGDYITVRHVDTEEEEEEHAGETHHHEHGADDPHLWLDPLNIRDVVSALVPVLAEMDIDVSACADSLISRLESLNDEITEELSVIPAADRKLATGHESMGYFAQRYNFQIIGMIIPSLSSQGSVSAADLAELKTAIEENQVKAIFTEVGTSAAVAETIAEETGVKVVPLTVHALPDNGDYFTFMKNIANIITEALK